MSEQNTNQTTELKSGKITIGKSSDVKIPSPGDYSIWIENGVWYAAETVDRSNFGPHDYGDGVGECRCGCSMYSSSSHGYVDPFGACPLNPKTTRPADNSAEQLIEQMAEALRECANVLTCRYTRKQSPSAGCYCEFCVRHRTATNAIAAYESWKKGNG